MAVDMRGTLLEESLEVDHAPAAELVINGIELAAESEVKVQLGSEASLHQKQNYDIDTYGIEGYKADFSNVQPLFLADIR